jgi:hypothetical protein
VPDLDGKSDIGPRNPHRIDGSQKKREAHGFIGSIKRDPDRFDSSQKKRDAHRYTGSQRRDTGYISPMMKSVNSFSVTVESRPRWFHGRETDGCQPGNQLSHCVLAWSRGSLSRAGYGSINSLKYVCSGKVQIP